MWRGTAGARGCRPAPCCGNPPGRDTAATGLRACGRRETPHPPGQLHPWPRQVAWSGPCAHPSSGPPPTLHLAQEASKGTGSSCPGPPGPVPESATSGIHRASGKAAGTFVLDASSCLWSALTGSLNPCREPLPLGVTFLRTDSRAAHGRGPARLPPLCNRNRRKTTLRWRSGATTIRVEPRAPVLPAPAPQSSPGLGCRAATPGGARSRLWGVLRARARLPTSVLHPERSSIGNP